MKVRAEGATGATEEYEKLVCTGCGNVCMCVHEHFNIRSMCSCWQKINPLAKQVHVLLDQVSLVGEVLDNTGLYGGCGIPGTSPQETTRPHNGQ